MNVSDMKSKVLRILGSSPTLDASKNPVIPITSTTYSSLLLIDGINAGLDAITSKIWKRQMAYILGPLGQGHPELSGFITIGSVQFTLPQGELGTIRAVLPDDMIDIESIWSDRFGSFLPQVSFHPGEHLDNVWANSWFLFPEGSINFVMDLNQDEVLTMFYSSFWTPVSEADEAATLSTVPVQLESPRITMEAIALYASSYCLLNAANQTANWRQYATKVDSGDPVQNPAKEMSEYMLRRYQIEMDKLPKMEKGDTQGFIR
jgi:hypothetical protein